MDTHETKPAEAATARRRASLRRAGKRRTARRTYPDAPDYLIEALAYWGDRVGVLNAECARTAEFSVVGGRQVRAECHKARDTAFRQLTEARHKATRHADKPRGGAVVPLRDRRERLLAVVDSETGGHGKRP